MTKKYNVSLFIFRRDLRLSDNTGLMEALEESNEVLPIFIFTPEQVTNNPYKSDNSVQFMVESLNELDNDLKKYGSKLFMFYGKPDKIVKKIITGNDIDAVYVNRDYTPYSKERDSSIEKICEKNDTDFNSYEDVLLNPAGSITTGSDNVYEKFTPYFKKAVKYKVRKPKINKYKNYCSSRKRISGQFTESPSKFYKHNKNLVINGGRKNAMKKLNNLEKHKNYNKERDILHIETTRLSAPIKFGCVSIREVYYKMKSTLGMKNELIKQLYWRDFFYNITEAFPRIMNGKNRNFKEQYSKIKWIKLSSATNKQKKLWNAWTQGTTGFPVVDAAMREMNVTGFMHNRGRLIVASFLTKLMMWSWEDGEKYFANRLTCYDFSNNSGGWQWSSGSGVDSQPYFRIMSPISQSEKFDKDAIYIKKWCPELKDVKPEHIHNWEEHWDDEEYEDIDYPEPILDYKKARENAIKQYKKGLYK